MEKYLAVNSSLPNGFETQLPPQQNPVLQKIGMESYLQVQSSLSSSLNTLFPPQQNPVLQKIGMERNLEVKSSLPNGFETQFPPQQNPEKYVVLNRLRDQNIPKYIPNRDLITELVNRREIENTWTVQSDNIVQIYGYIMDEHNSI